VSGSSNVQVVLCVDDSASMAESGRGELALRSMAVLLTALSRVQVAELGVYRFGEGDSVEEVHPLGAPFSPADGPDMVKPFTFSSHNSLSNQPTFSLLSSLENTLNERGSPPAGRTTQQLVLILGDGHFHEKERLRSKIRSLSSSCPAALFLYVALDRPDSSLLDMKSVSFEHGKPKFDMYMDSFPFPHYLLVQRLSSLPPLLSDLLRQWFEVFATG